MRLALFPHTPRRKGEPPRRQGAKKPKTVLESSWTSWRLEIIALAPCLALVLSGCLGGSYAVPRVVEGRTIMGRFVSEDAYAAYLQASMLESEGKTRAGLFAYEQALDLDPRSPDIWTRIGASKCALGESPWAAFERASSLDPEYEAVWTAQAECHLSRGEPGRALDAARAAVRVEPNTTANVILLARVLANMGKAEEARVFLDELTIRAPLSVEAHRARLELALAMGDVARVEASARRIAEIAPDLSNELAERVPSLSPLARIDEALRGHDLDEARRLALSARISSGELALRALALGGLAEAREQADFALAADPADSDARVAKALVARLENDDAALEEVLSNLPPEAAPLSELGVRMLEEILKRRLGDP